METRTVEQVENWSTRRFSEGYAGLRELSDGEFSGAVRAGGAWLFMLNGRVIGIHEGSLDDFEDADGKAYAAPHPSLPLLFNMKEEGGETQAKYYTNDTPLSEADSTLSKGGFTGYVELSENVLSGDYYVVYYGGRSMSVAFVGASEQVVSGDEAFKRAADEVGIYEVRDVDIEVIDLPEPEEPDDSDEPEPATGSGTAAASDGSSAGPGSDRSGANADTGPSGPNPDSSHGSNAGPSPDPTDTSQQRGATDSPAGSATTATGQTARSPESDATSSGSAPEARTSVGEAESATEVDSTPDTPEVETESTDAPGRTPDDSDRTESASEQTTDDEGMFGEEERWRETTTIPSLDPDRTEGGDDAPAATAQGAAQTREQSDAASGESRARRSKSVAGSASGKSSTSDAGTASESSGRSGRGNAAAASAADDSAADEANARVEELRSRLRQREQQVERLENSLSTVRSERNELKRERDALRQEVERLEAELESAKSGGAASGADRRLDRAQAFDGTNLFVRYRSKGEPTLKEAAAGNADAEDVNGNLRLEHHTQFEADDAAVDGRPFEEFLTDSFEHRFVSWLVEELLYEIRDTGHRNGLRELYDAIPRIDRVDLHGSVSAGTDDEDTRQESFDVIARDRMGNPLVVADLNGSRDPTTGEMMGTHVDAATGVAEAHDELAGAFQVTESFFEPEALETAESATSGGLLSREKRESFVKLSRKRGYHLCLVESRSGGFHLNVPEL
ncbi:hypothetical protein NGM10_01785 [Halorussus salilacus]|uniref:DUF7527 domain-containing protein n=1 Tax=Halorussus salilacus TaxID=2953750 RepID=UPI0020A0EDA7|nr:hypothetical protein [Halorussus salilacus]USZ68483.1 hypothetical protein NGM10_01785 [Halorussus salilacus]